MHPETQAAESHAPIRGVWRAVRLLACLYVFIGALQILKTGAQGFDVLQTGGFLVRNAGSTLGLGWIGALLTLSGSPVAATALSLRATGSITEIQGFTMVTGGRIGAAFVVLLVATLFAFRRGEGRRLAPVSTAVMALTVTFLVYVPGAVIGVFLLNWDRLAGVQPAPPHFFGSGVDVLYGWMLVRIESLPSAILFVGGLVLIVAALKALDALIPELDEDRFQGTRLQWLRRKWPMFFLGIVVTILTLSVSVALTVLVPLVGKGYVKREDLIPYIIGADIGTLVDKLVIAFLVGAGSLHPASPVRIIVAEIVGAGLVGLFIMAFVYVPFRRLVWRFQRSMLRNQTRLAIFTAALFVTPLAIIGFSGVIG